MSAYVEIPRPYETGPGRFTVELRFPASSKRRAEQHHHVAWRLADVHGVEARTPYKVNRRWSVYEEQWGNGERHGGLDYRGLTVQGGARAVAGYLAALERVLDTVEGLATRAVREFGAWKRSVAAEAHLEYEDATTLRIRAREFRADALRVLVSALGGPVADGPGADGSRPLWEQSRAVAAGVWARAGGVDLVEAPTEAVAAHLARMVREEPEQQALFGAVGAVVRARPARARRERRTGFPVLVGLFAVGTGRDDPGRYGTAA
ncbi:hypothetical protein LUR56_31090 [Streptomyces sp. MT29]|nr:hypothetical protein [Streptomyces sp. MT29]